MSLESHYHDSDCWIALRDYRPNENECDCGFTDLICDVEDQAWERGMEAGAQAALDDIMPTLEQLEDAGNVAYGHMLATGGPDRPTAKELLAALEKAHKATIHYALSQLPKEDT